MCDPTCTCIYMYMVLSTVKPLGVFSPFAPLLSLSPSLPCPFSSTSSSLLPLLPFSPSSLSSPSPPPPSILSSLYPPPSPSPSPSSPNLSLSFLLFSPFLSPFTSPLTSVFSDFPEWQKVALSSPPPREAFVPPHLEPRVCVSPPAGIIACAVYQLGFTLAHVLGSLTDSEVA